MFGGVREREPIRMYVNSLVPVQVHYPGLHKTEALYEAPEGDARLDADMHPLVRPMREYS